MTWENKARERNRVEIKKRGWISFFFFWKRCWGFQFGLKISRCRGKQHTIHCRLCPYGLFEARVEPCFGTRVLPIMFTHFTCQVHQVSPSLQNVTQCFYFLLNVNFPLTDYWFYSMRIIHLVTLYTPVTFLCDILMAIMLSDWHDSCSYHVITNFLQKQASV